MYRRYSKYTLLAVLFLATCWGVSSQSWKAARAAQPEAAAPSHGYYYYFGNEKRGLTLDVSRVAVFYSDIPASGETAQRPLLSEHGVDDGNVVDMAIRGWQLASTKPEKRSQGGIALVVNQIDNARAADFVSPVFVGLDGGPVVVTQNILIGFRRGTAPARAEAILNEAAAGEILDRDWANMPGAFRIRHGSNNGFDVLEAANRLAQLPEVEFAEPDMVFTGRSMLIPNDTLFTSLWGLHNTGQSGGLVDFDMDLPEAWDITTGDPSIIVLVIDSGVQQNHPDINQIIPGIDTTSEVGDGGPINQCDNHGTPVAGCVLAFINNSLGVVGTCPDCRSASARPFISNIPCTGGWSSTASWTVDALTWGESIGVRVTNNSNFYGFTSFAIASKYSSMRNNGVIHFASA